jgi:chitinase
MLSAPIIVAYYTAWSIYSRSYFISDIPAEKITHINYAFANIGVDGRIALGDPWADVEKAFGSDRWDQPIRGNFHQLQQLKKKHAHLRTLISVGGWVRQVDGCVTQRVNVGRHLV